MSDRQVVEDAAAAGRWDAKAAERTRASVRMRLLLVWTLAAVAATLAPFDFGSTTPVHEHSFRLFEYGHYERDPIDFALNVLMFVPLGVLVERMMKHRAGRVRPTLLRAGAIALATSTVLEFFQQFVPSRDSSLIDVVANTLGCLAGVLLARWTGGWVEARMRALRARTSTAALAGVLAGVLAVTLLLSGALQARSRISTWNPDYPLLVGNERTGDRPWRGRVFSVAVNDAATTTAAAERFAADGTLELRGRRVAAFDFSGAAPYKDAAGHLPSLVWTDPPAPVNGEGVALTGRPWLQSEGPATELARRLQQTNAFTIRLRCATAGANQDGPARIVSDSLSPLVRNFTLGQQGSDLVIRLRTPQTGPNGAPFQTFVEGVFATTAARDIVVSYDGATLTAAVAESHRVTRTELTPATALPPVMALVAESRTKSEQLHIIKLTYIGSLFVIPGMLIAMLGRGRRGQLTLFALYLTAAAVLLEATLVIASGRPFDWINVATTMGIGAVVLTVAGAIALPVDDRQRSPRPGWLPAQIWS